MVDFEPIQYAIDTTYFPVAGVTCIVFLFTFLCLGEPFSRKFFSLQYEKLDRKQRVDWVERINSNIHAVLTSLLCVYNFLYDDISIDDPVWGNSGSVKFTCAIIVGYMISDAIIMAFHYSDIGSVYYFLHHGAIVFSYYFVMTYGVLPWFANIRISGEFSTVFVNQRWFLDSSKIDRKSIIYITNSIAMATVFFLCRVVSIPFYWYEVYRIWGSEACDRLGYCLQVMVVSCLVLDALNCFWLSKIASAAVRLLNGKSSKSRHVE